ncbi:collagen alpha-1(I) chain [Suricata suricatta]|uniref:collagen alpha-1(I) chain n=1 Tax=Suricata suricatta TaxID=37032 RepID=UPI0011558A7E|nr:collagen alpha-1(I) chain [Suricata suricatta]
MGTVGPDRSRRPPIGRWNKGAVAGGRGGSGEGQRLVPPSPPRPHSTAAGAAPRVGGATRARAPPPGPAAAGGTGDAGLGARRGRRGVTALLGSTAGSQECVDAEEPGPRTRPRPRSPRGCALGSSGPPPPGLERERARCPWGGDGAVAAAPASGEPGSSGEDGEPAVVPLPRSECVLSLLRTETWASEKWNAFPSPSKCNLGSWVRSWNRKKDGSRRSSEIQVKPAVLYQVPKSLLVTAEARLSRPTSQPPPRRPPLGLRMALTLRELHPQTAAGPQAFDPGAQASSCFVTQSSLHTQRKTPAAHPVAARSLRP